MSLFESGHSSASASLAQIAASGTVDGSKSALSLADVVERLVIGGWPGLQGGGAVNVQRVLDSYLDDVVRVDVARLDGARRHDPVRTRRLIDSIARNTSTEASLSALARDAGGSDGSLTFETVSEYMSALERLMVIEDQPSWAPHLRSRGVVRKAVKRHFVDPSLAAAAMRATPERLLKDPNTLGLLFESLVVRDLRVYAQAIGGHVHHYRDSSGVEADAIVVLPDGGWIAIEVKLSQAQVDRAAASLERFVSKVDVSRTGRPAAKVVITAGEYAFTRPDGVLVVPLGCLGP